MTENQKPTRSKKPPIEVEYTSGNGKDRLYLSVGWGAILLIVGIILIAMFAGWGLGN